MSQLHVRRNLSCPVTCSAFVLGVGCPGWCPTHPTPSTRLGHTFIGHGSPFSSYSLDSPNDPMGSRGPLDDGLEEEEEECVSEGNELGAKDEFSADENFAADFEAENLTCEDMEDYCSKENSSREMGRTDLDGVNDKTRPPPLETDEWDGPRELDLQTKDGERRIHSRQQLPVGTTWGPFDGKIEMSANASGLKTKAPVPVVLSTGPRWLLDVTWQGAEDNKNNCVVYSKGTCLVLSFLLLALACVVGEKPRLSSRARSQADREHFSCFGPDWSHAAVT
ncbi:zinc finger protein ZFPM2-like [Brachyhypopomus gauderio]|uniref:zinc finger protein ZFPM2-like n=1 Tax=Brachyhypopomus gauderio TaxID=698409 RepID=UPI0040430C60